MAKVSDVVDTSEAGTSAESAPLSRDELIQQAIHDAAEAAGGDTNTGATHEEGQEGTEGSEGTEQEDVEGEEQALARVAGQEEEPTAEDLRKIGGKDAEGLTDEQLLQAYETAKKDAETPEFKPPFPLYDQQGNKVERVEDLAQFARDLIEGKLLVGYNAMGKEQRKALNDILRVAANGHLNESKIATALGERNNVYGQLQTMKQEHEQWATDRRVIDQVLRAAYMGNIDPLKQLVQTYGVEAGRVDPGQSGPTADDRAMEQAGQQYVVSTLMPAAAKLATDYGADVQEVTQVMMHMLQNEPAEFLTQQKIDSILQHDLPGMLEEKGYARNGTSQTPDVMEEVKQLRATVQELKANKANSAVQDLRAKRKKVPAAGGGSTPGAGDSIPADALKSRDAYKRWSHGE